MNFDMYTFTPRKMQRTVQHALKTPEAPNITELRERWRASWTEVAFYFDLVDLQDAERIRKKRDAIVATLVGAAGVGLFLTLALLLGHATWSNG